jgi:hypothetical protein
MSVEEHSAIRNRSQRSKHLEVGIVRGHNTYAFYSFSVPGLLGDSASRLRLCSRTKHYQEKSLRTGFFDQPFDVYQRAV